MVLPMPKKFMNPGGVCRILSKLISFCYPACISKMPKLSRNKSIAALNAPAEYFVDNNFLI